MSFDFQDFRKAVKAELKRNPESFERVSGGRGQFAEWKLTAEEVRFFLLVAFFLCARAHTLLQLALRKRALGKWTHAGFMQHRIYHATAPAAAKTLPDFLRDLLDNRPSGMPVQQVERAVFNEWVRYPEVIDPFYDRAQLALMTLQTNPAFHDHDRDPSLWENAPPPSKPPTGRALLSRSLTALPMATSPLSTAPSAASAPSVAEEAVAFKRPERSRRRERSPSPVPDGGGAAAGRTMLSSQRGKRKKETATAESGQWIQCDRCTKWISTLEDNITDLSLYDDNNPNHLEYYCPRCRDAETQVEKRSSARLGSRGGPRPQYREQGPDSEAEIRAMLDDLEATLIEQYQRGKSYWRKQETLAAPFSQDLIARCTEMEQQWVASVGLFKRRLVSREDDLESARHTFHDFITDQLRHVRETIDATIKAALR